MADDSWFDQLPKDPTAAVNQNLPQANASSAQGDWFDNLPKDAAPVQQPQQPSQGSQDQTFWQKIGDRLENWENARANLANSALAGTQHGLTFGLDVPMNAALAATAQYAGNHLDPNAPLKSWRDYYSDALAKARSYQQSAEAGSPIAYGASRALGNTVPFAAAPELPAAEAVEASVPSAIREAAPKAVEIGSKIAASAPVQGAVANAALSGAAGGAEELAKSGDIGKAAEAAKESAYVGGALGAALPAAGMIWSAGKGMAGRLGLGPKVEIGGIPATEAQAAQAGERLAQAGGGAEALDTTLANADRELVPESEPTTTELAPSTTMVDLENQARKQNANPFIERQQQQQAARVNAVAGEQPTGNAQNVGTFFTNQLNALDEAGQQQVAQAKANVQGQTAGIASNRTPEQLGGQARAGLMANRQATMQAENELWQPFEGAYTYSQPFKDSMLSVYQGLSPTGQKGLAPVERRLQAMIQNLPDEVAIKAEGGANGDIQDLRRQINAVYDTASRSGASDVAGRALSLKRALDGTLSDVVNRQADYEAQQVAAGQLDETQKFSQNLQQELLRWRDAREGSASVANAAEGSSQNGPVRSSINALGRGAGGTQAGGFSNSESNSGVQSPSAEKPKLTPEDAQAYQTASQASQQRIQTYDTGNVGNILEAGENPSIASETKRFALPDEAVMGKIFNAKGEAPVLNLRRYLDAGGDPDLVHDYAMLQLRRANVVNPDGTIDPKKLAAWQTEHQPLVDELASRGNSRLGDTLSNAQRAQSAYDVVLGNHTKAVQDYQKSVFGKFIDNDDVDGTIGKMLKNGDADGLAQIWNQVKGDPDASAGMRKSVADWIGGQLQGAYTAGGSPIFRKADSLHDWIQSMKPVLRPVFGGQGMNNIEAVAADLRRSAVRAQQGFSPKSASPSGESNKTYMAIIGEKVGEFASHALNASPHARAALELGSAAAGPVMSWARQRGVQRVNDLIAEGLLNPEVARQLLARAPSRGLGNRQVAMTLQRLVPAIFVSNEKNAP